jgi:hypothetical protein
VKRADHADLEAAVREHLRRRPNDSANAVCAAVGGRRSSVLAALRSQRPLPTRQRPSRGGSRPLLAAVRTLLAQHPDASADEIACKLQRRRKDVGAAVRAIRGERETEPVDRRARGQQRDKAPVWRPCPSSRRPSRKLVDSVPRPNATFTPGR